MHDPRGVLAVPLSSEMSSLQADGITDGLELWNRLGFTRLQTEDDPSASRIGLSFRPGARIFFGIYEPGTGEIFINTSLEDRSHLGIVVAHELGHAMGLPHIDPSVRLSVMNPGNRTLAPTSDDNALLIERWRDQP